MLPALRRLLYDRLPDLEDDVEEDDDDDDDGDALLPLPLVDGGRG